MKCYALNPCLALLLIACCFIFSPSYGQQPPKIVGKPFSTAYDFANAIAQTMKLDAPDSAHTKFNNWMMQVVLRASDNQSKWIVIDFNKDRLYKTGTIESVSITGTIPNIIELYAVLYDNKVRKVKPEDVYTGVDKDGEIKRIRTDFRTVYEDEEGVFGRINILKSERTK